MRTIFLLVAMCVTVNAQLTFRVHNGTGSAFVNYGNQGGVSWHVYGPGSSFDGSGAATEPGAYYDVADWTAYHTVTYELKYTCNYGQGPETVYASYNHNGQNSGFVEWTITGVCGSSNWFTAISTIKNDTATGLQVTIYTNGSSASVGYLGPGRTATYTNAGTGYFTQTPYVVFPDGQSLTDPSWTSYATNSSPTGVLTNTVQTVYTPVYNGSTTNILWGTNAPNVGASAIVSTLVQIGEQAHNDANRLVAAMGTNGGVSVSVNAGTNELLRIARTNEAYYSEVREHATNTTDAIWGRLGNSWSNATTLRNLGSDAAGTYQSDMSSATGSVGSALSGYVSGMINNGSGNDLKFMFVGQEISLDPSDRFPGLLAVSKIAWSIIAVVLFLRWMAGWVHEIALRTGSVLTGGVPNLSGSVFGNGGNMVGGAVSLIVPVIFCLLWVAVLMFAAGSVATHVGLLPDTFSIGNSVAAYLLDASFPVSLVLGLAGARVTLPLASSAIVVVASFAIRFLPGM